jgi:hypothetical protein
MYVSKYISKYISRVIIFYYIYTKYFEKKYVVTKKNNLHELYNDFYNKKINSNEPNKISKLSKEVFILNENKNNIFIDGINNYFSYKFGSKQNYYYNIKCNLFACNVKNIKLVIDSNLKKIVYDMNDMNNIFKNNIDEFEFILDNNYFDLNNICICLLFYGDNIEIKEISFKVIENEGTNKKYPIVIFNINTRYIPIYLDVNNILEYVENKEIDKSNNFFVS